MIDGSRTRIRILLPLRVLALTASGEAAALLLLVVGGGGLMKEEGAVVGPSATRSQIRPPEDRDAFGEEKSG